MRCLDIYSFKFKNKEFYNLPALIKRYLSEQGLDYKRFLYFFEESAYPIGKESAEEADERVARTGRCAKLLREFPAIGTIETEKNRGRSDSIFLTNVGKDGGCTEEQLAPRMKKLFAGLDPSTFWYADIDFFNKTVPSEREKVRNVRVIGASICLTKDVFSSRMHLIVDCLFDGIYYDTRPYAEAMQKLLSGMKYYHEKRLLLTDAEEERIKVCNERAKKAFEDARAYYEKTAFDEGENARTIWHSAVNVDYKKMLEYHEKKGDRVLLEHTVAPALKKAAKKFGFAYEYVAGGIWHLYKRTKHGHYMTLYADKAQMERVFVSLHFKSVGVFEQMFDCAIYPTSQQEADRALTRLVEILAQSEDDVFAQIEKEYPPAPDWYVPTGFRMLLL